MTQIGRNASDRLWLTDLFCIQNAVGDGGLWIVEALIYRNMVSVKIY